MMEAAALSCLYQPHAGSEVDTSADLVLLLQQKCNTTAQSYMMSEWVAAALAQARAMKLADMMQLAAVNYLV